jgi:hypothetical protein
MGNSKLSRRRLELKNSANQKAKLKDIIWEYGISIWKKKI